MNKIIYEDSRMVANEIQDSLQKLAGKKILITGSAGMLGSTIVYSLMYINEYKLKENPIEMYLVIRGNKKPFGKVNNINYINLDIAKYSPKVKGVHYIIHAASKAAPKYYTIDRVDTLNTNILGLYNLLKIVDTNLISFLYFSSCDIYGDPQNEKPIGENYVGVTNHLGNRASYVEAKRVCETICLNYFLERKIPIKIARIFHVTGPGLDLNDGKALSDFIKFGLSNKNILILGDGLQKRSWLYSYDASIMFLKLLLSDKNGEVYNIANDSKENFLSIKKIADIVCQTFNKKYNKKLKVTVKNNNIKYYKGAVSSIKPDIEKFKRDFHYYPKTNIKKSISRIVDYLVTEPRIKRVFKDI